MRLRVEQEDQSRILHTQVRQMPLLMTGCLRERGQQGLGRGSELDRVVWERPAKGREAFTGHRGWKLLLYVVYIHRLGSHLSTK